MASGPILQALIQATPLAGPIILTIFSKYDQKLAITAIGTNLPLSSEESEGSSWSPPTSSPATKREAFELRNSYCAFTFTDKSKRIG